MSDIIAYGAFFGLIALLVIVWRYNKKLNKDNEFDPSVKRLYK